MSHALHLKSLVEKKLLMAKVETTHFRLPRIRVKYAVIIRRYEKTGKRQRLDKAMGRDRCLQTEAFLKAVDSTPNPFLALVDKLKIPRARRKAHGM